MANFSVNKNDSIGVSEQLGDTPPKTLVVGPEHLINGIEPCNSGVRHLIKEVIPVISKFKRVILEYKDADGKLHKRLIKNNGFSCEPIELL